MSEDPVKSSDDMTECATNEDEFPGRLLHQAALWDNVEFLEDLLNGDLLGHINCPDSWGRTALHAAATNANSKCLRLLLQLGANPNIHCGPRGEYRTPLHIAAEQGRLKNVSLLLSFGADFLARDSNGMIPLDLAEQGGHEDCMTVLREAANAVHRAKEELHTMIREAALENDVQKVKSLLGTVQRPEERAIILNAAPDGANTILYKACEDGHKELVKVLLENGADARAHPVTKYSPLYAACVHGRTEIAEILLKEFPHAIRSTTVEKWTPIFACCINGRHTLLDTLLRFPYPEDIKQKVRDKTNTWQALLPFDLNAKDCNGQTVLYLSCLMNNVKLVETLLNFRVQGERINKEPVGENKENDSQNPRIQDSPKTSSPGKSSKTPISPTSPSSTPMLKPARKISSGISALIHRLNIPSSKEKAFPEGFFCPVDPDVICRGDRETSLFVAVKMKNHAIIKALLEAGADPNIRIIEEEDSSDFDSLPSLLVIQPSTMGDGGSQVAIAETSALVKAVQLRDMTTFDYLVKQGARDDECRACYVAMRNKDDILMSRLLALKGNVDKESKINRKSFETLPTFFIGSVNISQLGSVTFSNLFPTYPVAVNWHAQKGLEFIKVSWLVDVAVSLNPKLKLSPKTNAVSLFAITRLDLSNNALKALPDAIFALPSLKVLNASQNRIESLPRGVKQFCFLPTPAMPSLGSSGIGGGGGRLSFFKRSPSANTATGDGSPLSRLTSTSSEDVPSTYFCPVLEEVYLQYNQLSCIPEAMFELPALTYLDVSNNKLQSLPFAMWSSPNLRDLNASLNLLSFLPVEDLDTLEENVVSAFCSTPRAHESDSSSQPKSGSSACESVCGGGASDGPPSDHLQRPSPSASFSSADESRTRRIKERPLFHAMAWSHSLEVQEQLPMRAGPGTSQLVSLNLAHNLFTEIPGGLACLAVSLTRLDLSHNKLSEVGPLNCFPLSLKQLDISHNVINKWVRPADPSGPLTPCRAPSTGPLGRLGLLVGGSSGSLSDTASVSSKASRPSVTELSGSSKSWCPHQSHRRLDSLRTLVLAGNLLTNVSLTLDLENSV
ncbi:unnamed protein product, partial [Cyprideis torosa]